MKQTPAATPADHGAEGLPRVRLQELAAAVRAGGETEDLLAMLVSRARQDLAARTVIALLPLGAGRWSAELVDGDGAEVLLGWETDAHSAIGAALEARDADALEAAGRAALREQIPATHDDADDLVTPVDAGREGMGALFARLAPRSAEDRTGQGQTPLVSARERPAAGRERLEGIATLMGMVLDDTPGAEASSLDDERGRIARDLHDLAIQELFAAGMELESLQAGLRGPAAQGLSPALARSAEASVQGIERAVTQIRQIVQSLRRERPEATLVERLRHETGIATAGLGFAPSLRLPGPPSDLDAEVPEDIAEDVVAVVRESLANAARHAHASAVAVAVTLFSEGVDRVVQVSVSDNGRGIDPSVSRRSGLANMASRARRHQGWVDALPLEQGTMISWRVTLPPR